MFTATSSGCKATPAVSTCIDREGLARAVYNGLGMPAYSPSSPSMGFFFNHNIHPYQEFQRRLETVRDYAARVGGLVDTQIMAQILGEEKTGLAVGNQVHLHRRAAGIAVGAGPLSDRGRHRVETLVLCLPLADPGSRHLEIENDKTCRPDDPSKTLAGPDDVGAGDSPLLVGRRAQRNPGVAPENAVIGLGAIARSPHRGVRRLLLLVDPDGAGVTDAEASAGCQLQEEFVFDQRTGVRLSTNMFDYRKVGMLDMPRVDLELLETRGSNACYGGSGISHSLANTHLVIMAIHNAIGKWVE